MRIAIVAGSAPPLSQGGVATSHFNLFRYLRTAGFDARLFTHEDIDATQDDPDIVRAGPNRTATTVARRFLGAGFRAFEPGTNPYHVADIAYSLTSARALRRNVADFAPDLLIVPDRGLPILWLDVPAGCRVIQIEHHNPARFLTQLPGARPPSRLDVRGAVWLGQRALRKVSTIVCPTRYMLDEFEKTFEFTGTTTVIPHVVDKQAFESVEARPVPGFEHLPVVYIPSGGSIVKGRAYIEDLIGRMSAVRPELRFFISGDDVSKDPRVFAPGALSWRENLAYAASCKLCVSPTLAENLSMAIIEALWLGLPVATFDVGGNRDLVDETCGALVEVGNVRALAVGASALLARTDVRPRDRAREVQARARHEWRALIEGA